MYLLSLMSALLPENQIITSQPPFFIFDLYLIYCFKCLDNVDKQSF